ncbi:hypothetical protein [Notoacmeibacter ruber]|nr:hypothetical protein [Notoacmeibacter ruber]
MLDQTRDEGMDRRTLWQKKQIGEIDHMIVVADWRMGQPVVEG